MHSDELTPLCLFQIAKWIEIKTGKTQQIIQTADGKITCTYHSEEPIYAQEMVIIADADIEIKTISWSDEFGIGLNINYARNENGSKVHVIFWDNEHEINRIEDKPFTYVEGAVNGLLVIYVDDKSIEITADDINEMTYL